MYLFKELQLYKNTGSSTANFVTDLIFKLINDHQVLLKVLTQIFSENTEKILIFKRLFHNIP